MKEINSSIIGKLKQNDEFNDSWESDPVDVPFFEDKMLNVTFTGLDPSQDPEFLADADKALKNFLAQTATDRLKLSRQVRQNCMDFLNAVGYDELDQALWDIKNPHDIWDFVFPQEVYVERRDRRDKDIYLYVACECAWEQEHGLQLVFRQGKQLTRISDQDGHLTEADAYDTPDTEDRLLSAFEK